MGQLVGSGCLGSRRGKLEELLEELGWLMLMGQPEGQWAKELRHFQHRLVEVQVNLK
jgi:hypothetical protein